MMKLQDIDSLILITINIVTPSELQCSYFLHTQQMLRIKTKDSLFENKWFLTS